MMQFHYIQIQCRYRKLENNAPDDIYQRFLAPLAPIGEVETSQVFSLSLMK